MGKITPFLWFKDEAEEAMNFYVSTFKDSKVGEVSRYPEGVPGQPAGKVMMASFQLAGQDFLALNGGPEFKFTEATSFLVDCETQEEVDYYWERLSASPADEQCGWLKDKFGLSWQIIPRRLGELMSDPVSEKAGRVTQAMLQMKKIDVAKLEEAYAG